MTRFIDVPAMSQLIQAIGIDECIDQLAKHIESDFIRWPEFAKSARVANHSPNGVIELLDQRGALIRQLTISENVLVFPLEGVSAGTYMLRFASKGTRTNVGPLVITE